MNNLSYRTLSILSFIIVILQFNACTNESKNQKKDPNLKQFTQVSSKDSGIRFSNDLIDDPLGQNTNVMSFDNYFHGGGVAIGDINNDGLQDIFFIGNEVLNKLYLNEGDLKFKDISKKAKINVGKKWAVGVTMADVNGDGWQDIYVSQSSNFNTPRSERKNLLYINNKDLTFTESAALYGLDDDNLSHQAIFWDFDKDGDLDCYVMNTSRYVRIPLGKVLDHLASDIKYVKEASGKLFRNDNNRFINITESAGMLKYGFGLNAVVSDINQDGWPDLYVTNDYSVPDFMYINQKNGTFRDEQKLRTKQISFYGMGSDIADINNDGSPEIAVVDMAANDHVRDKTLMASMNTENFWIYVNDLNYQHQYMFNSLQLNNGNGNYSNIAHLAGVGKTDWSWAVLLADFDNDGYNDYYTTNGFKRYARDNDSRRRMEKIRIQNNGSVPMGMRKKLYDQLPQVKLSNLMYKNNGDLHFNDQTKDWGLNIPSFSNGASYGDLDNDGDLDLVVNNIGDLAFLFQNNSTNNYLRFKLKGQTNASPLIGTSIKLYMGNEVQYREYCNTRGYLSAVESNVIHFGLGENSQVDKVEITWPSGNSQVINNPKINKLITVKESKASKDKIVIPNNNDSKFEKGDSLNIPTFTHLEKAYNDFAIEVLLPHKQSTLGPFIAKGDVNGDQLDDFYIGGAAGQSGMLYLQISEGKFEISNAKTWSLDIAYEDQGALFFDSDGDKDLDLYIVSGSSEFKPNDPLLQDRLYINDGNGQFKKSSNRLPKIRSNGSKVKAADYDKDGDLDLFVGARGIPLKYPYADQHQLLENRNGKFTNIIKENGTAISGKSMINDFVWMDFNGDQVPDLVTLGEWSSINFYANINGHFENRTATASDSKKTKGWWYSIASVDVDNDGDLDLVCGNIGTNSKFVASEEKPFTIFAKDFDNNGTCDVVLSEDYKGELVPTRGRQCSSEQMPFIKDKFKNYNSFANANIDDIFGDNIKDALHLEATCFESSILINNNGQFTIKALPSDVQVSPINGIIVDDINNDGNIDIIVGGNKHNVEVETPRYDASIGYVLMGNGKGAFEVLPQEKSGLQMNKNVKDIVLLNQNKNKNLILVANNNDKMEFFKSK